MTCECSAGEALVVTRRLDALAEAIRARASWDDIEWHFDHTRSAVDRALGIRKRDGS